MSRGEFGEQRYPGFAKSAQPIRLLAAIDVNPKGSCKKIFTGHSLWSGGASESITVGFRQGAKPGIGIISSIINADFWTGETQVRTGERTRLGT